MAETLNPSLSSEHLKSRKRKYSSSGTSIIETYVVPSASRAAFEGSSVVGMRHPTYQTSYLQEVDEEPYGGDNGGDAVYRYILTFGPRSAKINTGGNPDAVPLEEGESVVALSGSSAPQNVPIANNPRHSDTWDTTKPGVDSYISPAPQYVCRIISRIPQGQSPTINHDELTKNVGKRFSSNQMVDYYLQGAPDNAYMLFDISILDGEFNRETAYTFLFSPEPGWDVDIYEAATT